MLFGSFLIQQGHPGFSGETGVPGHQGMPVRVILHASISLSHHRDKLMECFSHIQGSPGLRGSIGIGGPKGFPVSKSFRKAVHDF